MILKWLRSSHRMCAARHCPQFASNMQTTIDLAAGEYKCVLTVAIPTLSQNIKWRGYFKCQMHGDVGKLKVQPQGCKVIPRAAPSVEVLWPKCNAPEIPEPFKSSTLQGFFFKATTDGLRWHQTFKSCYWGPNMLNENIQKLLLLIFFLACPRRNIRLMTLSGCNKMQSSRCSCCETPFQWNLAFFTLFYMFQLYFQAFLACQNLICLAAFAICLLRPLVTSWYFEMLIFDENT